MQIKNCIKRIEIALKEMYFLAQAGTAVGTGINTKKGFDKKIALEIKKITRLPFRTAPNKFEALASHEPIVNLSGTFNTLAVAIDVKERLLPSLKLLEKELAVKVTKFKNIVKIGRTHLQDATPLTLGQQFSGYHMQIKNCIKRIEIALKEMYFLAQGLSLIHISEPTRPY